MGGFQGAQLCYASYLRLGLETENIIFATSAILCNPYYGHAGTNQCQHRKIMEFMNSRYINLDAKLSLQEFICI